MIPETNPAAKPKQVKINGKQPNHPHPVSEKNAGRAQGEFAVKEGEGNEVFLKNCGIFLVLKKRVEYTFIIMEDAIYFSSTQHYLDLLMTLIAFITLVITIMYQKRLKKVNYFFIYPLASIVQTILSYWIFFITNKEIEDKLIYYSQTGFLLIEFVILFNFFYNSSSKKAIKWLLVGIQMTYFPLYIYNSTLKLNQQFVVEQYLFQNIYLAAGSILTIADIYISEKDGQIEKNPYFLIPFAILTLSLCGLPLLLAKDFIVKPNDLLEYDIFTINYILYIILFSTISIAYICMKNQKSLNY